MHPQLRPFTQQLFLDFCAIFSPEWPLNFFVIMIYQVIWPSPGTLVRGGQVVNGHGVTQAVCHSSACELLWLFSSFEMKPGDTWIFACIFCSDWHKLVPYVHWWGGTTLRGCYGPWLVGRLDCWNLYLLLARGCVSDIKHCRLLIPTPRVYHNREVGGWGRDPFSRHLMSPTPRRKWYLTTGRRFH